MTAQLPPTDRMVTLDYWHARLTEADGSAFQRSSPRVALDLRALEAGNAYLPSDAPSQEALAMIVHGKSSVHERDDSNPADDDERRSADNGRPATHGCAIVLAFAQPQVHRTLLDEDGVKESPIEPVFWIPVDLEASKDDVTVPALKQRKEMLPPQFFRRWLSVVPNEPRQVVPLAEFSDYNEQLSAFALENETSLATYLSASINFFKNVTGVLPSGCEYRGYWAPPEEADADGKLMHRKLVMRAYLLSHSVFATYWLDKLYRSLREPQVAAALSRSAIARLWRTNDARTWVDPLTSLPANDLGRHVAMAMTLRGARDRFPLNDPQRRVVAAATLTDPTVVGVNGPPGTGKTALLRAVIADRWTTAALSGSDPPIIVVGGATRQSIRNVASTFDNLRPQASSSPESPLGDDWTALLQRRWIAGLEAAPYAIQAPSSQERKSLADDGKFYLDNSFPTHASAFSKAASAADKPALSTRFCNLFRAFLLAVETARQPVQTDCSISDTTGIDRLLPTIKDVTADDRDHLESGLGRGPTMDLDHCAFLLQRTLKKIVARQHDGIASVDQDALDVGLRAIAFHLAARYWEARWIQGLPPGQNPEFTYTWNQDKESGEWYIKADGRKSNLGYPPAVPLQADMLVAVDRQNQDPNIEPILESIESQPENQHFIHYFAIPGYSETLLRRTAMLFPCIVSTLNSLPKVLRKRRINKEWTFHYGLIDLLVIDEAGQGLPEYSAPLFALASSVLAVGDLKQLAPVPHLNAEVDRRLLRDMFDTHLDVDNFINRGWSHQQGSCLALTLAVSHVNERGGTGLRLRHHFRCPQRVVDFCTDLIYHDHEWRDGKIKLRELEYVKRKETGFPLPAFAYVMSGSIEDDQKRENHQWMNHGEAHALVYWLVTEGMRAFARDNAGAAIFGDFVAILTPYAGQARLIRTLLRRLAGIESDDTPNPRLPKFLLDVADDDKREMLKVALTHQDPERRLIIGTVHSLQGAERPVVLFSAVNSKQPDLKTADGAATAPLMDRVFIDRDGGRILNVAASRAQKSFILFGHADLFFSQIALTSRGDETYPTQLLGQHLAGIVDPDRRVRAGIEVTPGVRLSPNAMVIVESPAKAALISNFLPPTFQLYATGGRFRKLARDSIHYSNKTLTIEPAWELDPRDGDEQKLLKQLAKVGTRLLDLPFFIVATDPDREGEAIGWHVLDVLRRHAFFDPERLKIGRLQFTYASRIEILSGLREAIKKARSAGAGAGPIATAAIARAVIDRLIEKWWSDELPGKHLGRIRVPLLLEIARAASAPRARLRGSKGPFKEVPDGPAGFHVDILPDAREQRSSTFDEARLSPACTWTLAKTHFLDVPCPGGASTADALRLAWLRHKLHPLEVMHALDALRLKSAPQQSISTDADALVELSAAGEMRIKESRLADISQIKNVARTFPADDPLAFAKQIAGDLDQLADGNSTYEKTVGSIARLLYPNTEIAIGNMTGTSEIAFERIERTRHEATAGPFLQDPSDCVRDLCVHIACAKRTVGADEHLQSARSRIRVDGSISHPPLLTKIVPAGAPKTDGVPGQMLELLRNASLLSLMRPARVIVETWSARIANLLGTFETQIAYTDQTPRGWLNSAAARAHRADFMRQHGFLDGGTARPSRQDVAQWLGSTTLERTGGTAHSPDTLLEFMLTNGLGTPSTYASAVDGTLGRAIVRKKGGESSTVDSEAGE